MVLDLCSLVMVGIGNVPSETARLTFAMARHAAVDLTQVFNVPPRKPEPNRLPSADLAQLRAELAAAGVSLHEGTAVDLQLAELRQMYEPCMNALANHLLVSLPPWIPASERSDNWQTTAWEE
jgi:hypothetical protein